MAIHTYTLVLTLMINGGDRVGHTHSISHLTAANCIEYGKEWVQEVGTHKSGYKGNSSFYMCIPEG